jgi:hypothetical protein
MLAPSMCDRGLSMLAPSMCDRGLSMLAPSIRQPILLALLAATG